MSGFLYFAAGIVNPITLELVGQLDLRHAFPSIPMHGVINGRTPSGASGTLMCEQSRLEPFDMAYRPDEQVWRKRPGDECVYVGYWKESPPTPRDLARHARLAGDSVALADGNQWQVPRFWWHAQDGGFQLELPRYYDLDPAGNWVYGKVDERFTHLQPLADRLLNAIYFCELDPSIPRLTTDEMLTTGPQLLAVNYVVSPIECAMLRLFKEGGAMRRIAELSVDYDRAMRWVKKKRPEESLSASSGTPT